MDRLGSAPVKKDVKGASATTLGSRFGATIYVTIVDDLSGEPTRSAWRFISAKDSVDDSLADGLFASAAYTTSGTRSKGSTSKSAEDEEQVSRPTEATSQQTRKPAIAAVSGVKISISFSTCKETVADLDACRNAAFTSAPEENFLTSPRSVSLADAGLFGDSCARSRTAEPAKGNAVKPASGRAEARIDGGFTCLADVQGAKKVLSPLALKRKRSVFYEKVGEGCPADR